MVGKMPSGGFTPDSGGTDDTGGGTTDSDALAYDPSEVDDSGGDSTRRDADPGRDPYYEEETDRTTTDTTEETSADTLQSQLEGMSYGGTAASETLAYDPDEIQADDARVYREPIARPEGVSQTEAREAAAEQFSEQTGRDITRSDIVRGQEGLTLRDELRQELAAERTRQRTGRDVGREDFVVRGGDVRMTAEAQQRRAAELLSEGFDRDIRQEDVEVTGGRAELTGEARERIAAEQVETQTGREALTQGLMAGTAVAGVTLRPEVATQFTAGLDDAAVRDFGLERGRDFTIETRGDDVAVETTEDFRERSVAQQIDLPESTVEEGEEFTVSDEGEVELTAEGRRRAIEAQLVERGYAEVESDPTRIPHTVPLVGGLGLGGGTDTIDIERPDQQLEFDDEGNLINIRQPEYTQADIEASERELADTLGFGVAGETVATGAGYLAKGTDVAADVSLDVGATVQEGVVIKELGGVRVGIDPAAEVAGDVQELGSRTVGLANPFDEDTTSEDAAQFLGSAQDITRPESEEIGDTTFTETATEKVTAGGLSPIRFGIELPATAQTGALVAGEAVEFTGEAISEEGVIAGSIEAGAAGVETGVEAGEQVVRQTIENPYATAGTLLGSGAIMGGAAAIGTRTGTATRFAIQPGEEILGYGGGGLFRRLPGERTSRLGGRLFPNNEPVIFSEEAAIRGGRRVGRGVRNIGQRVGVDLSQRLRLGELAASERAQLGGQRGRSRSEGEETSGEFDDLPTEIVSTSPVPGRLDEPDVASTGPSVRRGGSAARERAGGLSPPRPELEEEIGGERPADFERQTFDPLTGTFEGEGEGGTTQGAQQRLEEAQQPFTTEDAVEARQESLEGATGVQPAEQSGALTIEGAQERLDIAKRSAVLTETDPLEDVRSDVEQFQELDTEQELRTDTEMEQETRQELFQEVETETEVETELAFETEAESRREREVDETMQEDEPLAGMAFTEDIGALYADFRDPLTGELLRTERGNPGVRDI